MKSFIIFAFLVAIAASASLSDSGFHVHLNLKNVDSSMVARGVISRLVSSMIENNQHDIGLHLHFDGLNDDELEDFGFGDIFGGIKKGFEEAGKGIKKGVDVVNKGVNTAVDKIKDGVNKGVDGVKKGFNAATTGINIAIKETEKAFNKVKNQIVGLKLPNINIPKLIEPIINIAKLISKLVPCGMALRKAAPAILGFAKAAVGNKAADAVQNLMVMLQYMPEISEKCIGAPFNIPPNVMNKIQCVADIVGLAAIIGQFILAPENVIASVSNIKNMIELIPKTIADCTGAFA